MLASLIAADCKLSQIYLEEYKHLENFTTFGLWINFETP